jgi:hypothetical protein
LSTAAAPPRPLSPYAAELVSRCEAARERARLLVDGISEAEFNWSATRKQWSMAQCFDHLCRIGEALLVPLQRAVERTEARGWTSSQPPRYGFFSRAFIRGTGPLERPPAYSVPTQRLYAPAGSRRLGEMLARFDHLQDELQALARRSDGLDLVRVKVPSPALPLLRLSMGAWLESLVGHQERHLDQAARVRDHLRRTGP